MIQQPTFFKLKTNIKENNSDTKYNNVDIMLEINKERTKEEIKKERKRERELSITWLHRCA